MKVPFVDLVSQYHAHQEAFNSAMLAVCERGSFVLGPQLEQFEREFASFLGTRFAVGVGNGTESLTLSYQALGLGAGDEVIMPANTFVATATGAISAGLKPVLVDIDRSTYLLDYDKLESVITPRTKAICPVHLYGRACDMDRVMQFAAKHDLRVVEDTAQAHGAKWNGKCVGTFGDFGSFSFYPGKNLGAYGDAGGVVTNSEEGYKRLRRLRNYGSEIKYEHPEFGTNSRLDSMQAAVLSVKLKHLADWNAKRWQAAATYVRYLKPLESKGLVLPDIRTASEHVFHLFIVQVEDRKRVMEHLGKHEVQTGIHYPIPFHIQGGYKDLGYGVGDFPVTEAVAKKIVSLPMFPEITEAQIAFVCEKLSEALA